MTSRLKVFETVELFEAILEHVSFRDLLRLGCVCKNFQHALAGSVVLRRRLHLQPALDQTGRRLRVTPSGLDISTFVDLAGRNRCNVFIRLDELPSHGSWREMYAYQPPHIGFLTFACLEPNHVFRCTDGKYMTLGMMLDAMREHFEHFPGACGREPTPNGYIVDLLNDEAIAEQIQYVAPRKVLEIVVR